MIRYIILLLYVFEAALLFYRVKRKSMLGKATIVLRGVSVLLIALLAVRSHIAWGFRYHALVALLTVSAAVHGVRLIRRKHREPEIRGIHVMARTVGMWVLILTASLPALVFPEYRKIPTTGPYPIGNEVQYLTDESRMESYGKQGGPRKLTVEFWYPEGSEGTYPLLVFSHGAFGIRTSNETLFRELASHGYVVCSIDHTYHCLYTKDEKGKMLQIDSQYRKELAMEDAKKDKQKSFVLYKKWMDLRVADIHFVIDTVASHARSNPLDGLYGLVNTDEIGMMGHSLGGSAALGMARLRGDIDAVIALESPFLCDILDVEKDEFLFEKAPYPVPVLNIYSDSSRTHLEDWAQYAQNVRMLSVQDKVQNVHMEGSGHLSLTDLSLTSPLLTRLLNGHKSSVASEDCLTRLNEICLSFFDSHLKNKP